MNISIKYIINNELIYKNQVVAKELSIFLRFVSHLLMMEIDPLEMRSAAMSNPPKLALEQAGGRSDAAGEHAGERNRRRRNGVAQCPATRRQQASWRAAHGTRTGGRGQRGPGRVPGVSGNWEGARTSSRPQATGDNGRDVADTPVGR